MVRQAWRAVRPGFRGPDRRAHRWRHPAGGGQAARFGPRAARRLPGPPCAVGCLFPIGCGSSIRVGVGRWPAAAPWRGQAALLWPGTRRALLRDQSAHGRRRGGRSGSRSSGRVRDCRAERARAADGRWLGRRKRSRAPAGRTAADHRMATERATGRSGHRPGPVAAGRHLRHLRHFRHFGRPDDRAR